MLTSRTYDRQDHAFADVLGVHRGLDAHMRARREREEWEAAHYGPASEAVIAVIDRAATLTEDEARWLRDVRRTAPLAYETLRAIWSRTTDAEREWLHRAAPLAGSAHPLAAVNSDFAELTPNVYDGACEQAVRCVCGLIASHRLSDAEKRALVAPWAEVIGLDGSAS